MVLEHFTARAADVSTARPLQAHGVARKLHQVHEIPTFSPDSKSFEREAAGARRIPRPLPILQGAGTVHYNGCGPERSEACRCTSSHAGAPAARDPDIPLNPCPDRLQATSCSCQPRCARGGSSGPVDPGKMPRTHAPAGAVVHVPASLRSRPCSKHAVAFCALCAGDRASAGLHRSGPFGAQGATSRAAHKGSAGRRIP